MAGAGAAWGRLHRGCYEKRAMGILARAAESMGPPAAAPQSHPVPTTGSNSPASCGACEEQQTCVPFFIPPCPLPPSSGGDFWLLSSNAEPPQGKAQALGRPQAPAPCRDALCSLAPRTCVCVCAHECTHACPHGAGQSGAFWRPVSKEVAAKIPIPAFSSAKVGTRGW